MDRQRKLASLSSSPGDFGAEVGHNINARRSDAGKIATRFETRELVNITEKSIAPTPKFIIPKRMQESIKAVQNPALEERILADITEHLRQYRYPEPLGDFDRHYGNTHVMLTGAMLSNGPPPSAITNRGPADGPPDYSVPNTFPEKNYPKGSQEEQRAQERIKEEQHKALQEREQKKYAEAEEKCWKMLENGVTDETGEPYLYKRHTIVEKKGDEDVKKEYLFAYSKNGGMEMMDPDTGVWRKPTEEEASQMREEMESIKNTYDSTVKKAMGENPEMAKRMQNNKVFEMFVRDPKNRSKSGLADILKHADWTPRNREALRGLQRLLDGGKKEESFQSKLDQAIEDSLPKTNRASESRAKAPYSPEYYARMQRLNQAIANIQSPAIRNMITNDLSKDPAWQNASLEEKEEAIAFFTKTPDVLLQSMFMQNLTEEDKSSIRKVLSSFNESEFKGMTELLSPNFTTKITQEFPHVFKGKKLFVNPALKALIEEEVRRRSQMTKMNA